MSECRSEWPDDDEDYLEEEGTDDYDSRFMFTPDEKCLVIADGKDYLFFFDTETKEWKNNMDVRHAVLCLLSMCLFS